MATKTNDLYGDINTIMPVGQPQPISGPLPPPPVPAPSPAPLPQQPQVSTPLTSNPLPTAQNQFDAAGFAKIADEARRRGTQVTPQQYQQYGGNVGDYSQLYGNTAFYNPDGSYTDKAPDFIRNFNNTAFEAAQRRSEAAGTQITPQEWTGLGGRLEDYPLLYGQNAYYNPDGSFTSFGISNDAASADPTTDILYPRLPELQVPDAQFDQLNTPAGYQDFLPQTIEDSPLFKYQLDRGGRELEQLMAARGLTGSGAELQANQDFLAQLLGEETERAANRAAADADRTLTRDRANQEYNTGERNRLQQAAMQNFLSQIGIDQAAADRLLGMQTDSANREERSRERAFSNLYDLLNLAAAQNPFNQAYQGLNQYASLLGIPTGGGGGGGSSAPQIPIPAGPAQDQVNLAQAQFNTDNSNALNNLIGGLVSGIFNSGG